MRTGDVVASPEVSNFDDDVVQSGLQLPVMDWSISKSPYYFSLSLFTYLFTHLSRKALAPLKKDAAEYYIIFVS